MQIINDILSFSVTDYLDQYWYIIRAILAGICTIFSFLFLGYFLYTYRFLRKNCFKKVDEIGKTGSSANLYFTELMLDSGYYEDIVDFKEEEPAVRMTEAISEVCDMRIRYVLCVFLAIGVGMALIGSDLGVVFLLITGVLVSRMTLLQRDIMLEHWDKIDPEILEEEEKGG